jgi:Kdo2-lipid IVA lauroyltransferase/acyltransferase
MKFRFRRYYLYYLGRVAIFFIGLLPSKIGLFISGRIGVVAYLILQKYRKITLDNLHLALGEEKTKEELRRIARSVFENLGKNAFELVRSPRINSKNIDRLVEIENPEIAREAFAKGNGIIIITAHIGNWELMASTLRLKGYPGVTVGRRIYFDKYDKYLNRLRKIQDVDVIYRDESPRRILKVLKENRIVGIVADQDVDSVEGVFVSFFGKDAYTPAGPAALAKVSGASLIPTFIVRVDGRHKLVFEEPIELVDTGDRQEDLIANTQKWSDVVESYIRQYPEQWVWMHRRWKTRKTKDGE